VEPSRVRSCRQQHDDQLRSTKPNLAPSLLEPAGRVATVGWVDEDGIIFEEAPLVEGEIIYKIIDSSNRKLMLGDRVLDENLFNNLILIFKTLEKSGLNLKTLRLENLSAQEIVVESPSMPKIYFSLRFDPDFSLSVFENLKKTNLLVF